MNASCDRIERLVQLSVEGDQDALEAFLREKGRRGDPQAVRNLAWRIVDGGGAFHIQFGFNVRSRIAFHSRPSLIDISSCDPVLCKPFPVPLLWSKGRERLFAADCVEQALPTFNSSYFGGYRVPISPERVIFWKEQLPILLQSARDYARGDICIMKLADSRALINFICREIDDFGDMPARASSIANAVRKLCRESTRPARTSTLLDQAVKTASFHQPNPGLAKRWQHRRLLQYLFGQVEPKLKWDEG